MRVLHSIIGVHVPCWLASLGHFLPEFGVWGMIYPSGPSFRRVFLSDLTPHDCKTDNSIDSGPVAIEPADTQDSKNGG